MAYSCNPPDPPEPQARPCGTVPAAIAGASIDDPTEEVRAQPAGSGELAAQAGLDVPAGQPSCVAPEAPDALVCWLNEAQTYVAQCGAGRYGASVSASYPAGRIGSNVSQAHANAQALAIAQAEAEAQLSCEWWNEEQSFTAQCGPGTSGNAFTVTTPAQTVHRPTLEEANAVALAMAREQAEAALVCLYLNDTQSYTAVCPEGTLGSSVTVSKGPSEEFLAETKEIANALALAAAQAEAESLLECVPDFFGSLQSFVSPVRGPALSMNLSGVASFAIPSFGARLGMNLEAVSTFKSPTVGAGSSMDLEAISTFKSVTLGATNSMNLGAINTFLN